MNKPRLMRLISILEHVRDSKLPFDLEGWAQEVSNADYIVGDANHPEACGTACCAAGWAALDPEFQTQGLRLVFEGMEIPDVATFNARWKKHAIDGVGHFWPQIEFEGGRAMTAAACFFGLSLHQADSLFEISTYGLEDEDEEGETAYNHVTPDMVIGRIRDLIDA